MNKRPNILFINTDQQSWNAVSAYGNPYLHTPNIDRLHRNGTSFMRSYCSDPVCAATRSSWATGLYTSETGVPFNSGYLHGDIQDIGQILNANGYNAFHCGKWHVPGRDVRESFHTLYYGKRDIGAGGGEYYDSASTHAVTNFLTTYDGDAPFYLQIGYVNPHDVCEYLHNHEEKRIPNPLQQGIIAEDELPPLPENFHYDENETVLQRVCRRTDDALIHSAILNGVRDWDELHWRYLIWNYYRFIEKVDAEIGVVLNVLQQTPFCEDTLIVFSADHGEACGSHQMFQKFTLYEESIRVPFIVACLGDGVPVQKNRFDREHFISGVDIVPTVYDYAGIDAAEAVQINRSDAPRLGGMSVRSLAEGDEVPWRDFAYVESNYWGRAVVADRYKYVTEYKPADPEDFRPPGPDASRLGCAQLFDLQEDPWETQNLASQSGYEDVIDLCRANLLAQEARLNRWQIEHPNPRNVISNWGDSLRTYWENLSAY